MFKFFRRNGNGKQSQAQSIKLVDIEGTPLTGGDLVMSLRYDLGTCRLVQIEKGYEYESLSSGEKVSYLRMVDAATTFQKVRKIEGPSQA